LAILAALVVIALAGLHPKPEPTGPEMHGFPPQQEGNQRKETSRSRGDEETQRTDYASIRSVTFYVFPFNPDV